MKLHDFNADAISRGFSSHDEMMDHYDDRQWTEEDQETKEARDELADNQASFDRCR